MKNKLYPHTPIQITHEKDGWQVYVEGQWYSKHEAPPKESLIDYIINANADDWCYPSTRINPNWNGWQHISVADLNHFAAQAETSDEPIDRERSTVRIRGV